MRNSSHRTFAPLLLALLTASFAPAASLNERVTTAKRLITAERFSQHVKYLASDELAGRLPASEGARLTAEYMIEQLKAAGCEPGGVDGTWFQPFDVTQGKRLVDDQAELKVQEVDRAWRLRDDWIPFPFSEMDSAAGPLAFAGYGITAPEHDYDDYADFDATGKILLILRYEPKADDPNAAFGGQTPSDYALFYRKARRAERAGAVGLLVVNPPNRDPQADELYDFNVFTSMQTYALPMAHITRETANALLQAAGAPDLTTLQDKLDARQGPLTRDLGLHVSLQPGVAPNKLQARNVIGVLPGNGSTNETIVVGAHRDHLGKVPRQFQRTDRTPVIHNGADDNASGTAGVLELARALGAGPPLRRNIMFIGFDAEEMGLFGSRHFVREPTVPLEHVKAMVNFDMIGRLAQDKYTVFGTATAKEFPELVEAAAAEVDLAYNAPKGMSGGSDHTPFLQNDVPALFAFTGIHQQYHRPEDDWELIDADGAARVLHMWYAIVARLAELESGPTFVEPTFASREVPAPRPAAEETQEPDARAAEESDAEARDVRQPSRGGMRVRLGVIPDMAGDGEPGMIIDTVLEDGAAQQAGLKQGDRIIRIGGEDIRDIYAYMRVLQDFKPNDEVDVVVLRDGKELTLPVKLQASNYGRRGRE